MVSNKLVAISLTMAVGASAFAGTSWDLANDWSPPSNPNGAWAYGVLSGSTFTAAVYSAGSYKVDGVAYVDKNTSSSAQGGVDAGQVSLLASINGVPDVRWTAPTTGYYDISLMIGGSQDVEGGTSGNLYAADAGFSINGSAVTSSSFSGNVMTWTLPYIFLTSGTTLDALVSDPGSTTGNNTMTKFHIAAVPEPAPFAVVGLGLLGFLRRRKQK